MADGRLMPDADMANTIVIGAQSGHIRSTKSWVLGRLLRDIDDIVDKEMKHEQAHVPPAATGIQSSVNQASQTSKPATTKRAWEALRISVFEVIDDVSYEHGVPRRDWVWFSGYAVILVQMVISIIPWIFNGDWSTFTVATSGNILALVGGSLPQWRQEKWACPKKGGATVTITQGNGSRHAMVILGKKGVGLDLEILAAGTRTAHASRITRFATAVLAFLWVVLLITVAGLKLDTWCKSST
jgi:hypothetical protein